jgi:shikimate dehydrogenase
VPAALRATGLASAVVLVRNPARAGDLVAAAGRLGVEVGLRPFDSEIRDGDLLVSTVPAGAADFYAERAGDSRPGSASVLDAVYAPWPDVAKSELQSHRHRQYHDLRRGYHIHVVSAA